MRRAGEVVRVAQGLAIVRCPDDEYPDVGTDLVTEDLESAGEVVEVFGPIERPYCGVTPAADVHLPALVGSALYAR